MKKKMILEKWKTKAVAMLMTGVMVFAMAPLGTGVAFADENDAEPAEEPTVEAVEDVVAETPEDVVADASEDVNVDEPEEETVQAAGVEAKGVLKDLGVYTMDLSKGSKKIHFDPNNPTPEMMVVYYMMQVAREVEEKNYFYGAPGQTPGETYIDLDGQGEAFDLLMGVDTSTYQDGPEGVSFDMIFNKLNTSNHKDSFTVMLTKAGKMYFDSVPAEELPPGYTSYYSGIKFVFKAAPAKPKPVAKKANTLTLKVKAKATKIKCKSLRKKSKTYAISKFINVSKAQGAVTYAKVSGSKKITISKAGKVTIKKKIKKGKYKVKVNVTAAGNKYFNKVTKTVTFVVKIKK